MKAIFNPQTLIFIGVILSAIGAFWASRQQAQFEHDLRKKSEEITELNREIVRQVIGGKSFCYLTIGSINNEINTGLWVVVHQGAHPIYDVNARIVDLQRFAAVKDDLNLTKIQQTETHLPIGNMIKATASMVRPIQLGSKLERDFNIFFSARNGLYTQLLRLRKIDGEWVSAIKIEKNGKNIFEKVHEKFPRNTEGKVSWN